ncbi:hypothetical protein MKX67_10255 [Cytobacillus sp. FSL W7-1323]|uniref:Swarming motility protein SwrB n=1 Tax=Cytobacillus kochii TaxID=859143 RepID=A0A248TCT7_9BACI|nr:MULTISPECIES: hypothetical protein [Cytobacillus]ASV65930.1 hypothetical protein CKF48_00475 [Cytobacillus kochii]MDQ0184799.1 hypothetical protein [Cytobacillus kochii]MEA1851985.1 hypothetical protein [Cytobacillus sp. OWB-43]MED1606514.1 hypothetical protein [Cytobacillus kochii]
MIVFFLIISLILNILAITAILLLYLRQNRFVSLEKEQKNNIEQMDQLLAIYITEMREENEAFLKQVQQRNILSPVNDESNVQNEPNPQELNKRYRTTTAKKKAASIYQANQANKDTHIDRQKEKNEATTHSSIQDLYHQGHSVDEIAKRMNKGKKEVELLLKFSKE